ncbi:MAG: polysaccharide biosynthesis tyrosine autokinase [Phycisphaerae bacterium]
MSRIPTRDQVPQVSRGPMPSGPRPQTPGGGPGGGFTGRDALRVVRQRWLLILLSLVVCSALAAGGTALWLTFAPMYTATAYIEVLPPKGSELSATQRLYNEEIMDRLVQDAAAIVKTEPVLTSALKNELITDTDWYISRAKGDVVKELDDEIDVAAVPNTNYIRVSMRGFNKDELPDIVNAVAIAFERDTLQQVSGTRQEQIDRLGNERDDLHEQLESTIDRIETTLRNAQIPNPRDRRNTLAIRMERYIAQMIELDMELAQAEESLQALQEQAQQGELANNPQVAFAIRTDPTVRSLRNAELNMATELQNMLQTYGPDHPRVVEMRSALEGITEQIRQYEQEIARSEGEAMLNMTLAEVSQLRAQRLKAESNYSEAETLMRDVQSRLAELEELENTRENIEANIERIDQALVDLRLLASGDYRVRVRRQATEPREPSMPKWHIMMPVGVLLGLTIGLGGAFLLEFIDTSVKSPSDISRKVELPVLGMIPHIEDTEEDLDDMRLAFRTHPNSLVDEAFRQIRTCLMFSGPASQRRSLLVTSPLPEDGRTSVALNLAASIARSGRRVLVVDANFRQPALGQLFPDAPEQGLSSAVVGQANWTDCVYEVEENFHIMPAGHMPPNPAELLGSDEMRQLLSEMENQYDQVLLDTAPCLVVTDPCVLASLTDGVVLVVRAGTNTYGIVQRTRDMLARVGARTLGVALNGVRATAGGYFRRNYETFYDYHQPHQLPSSQDA